MKKSTISFLSLAVVSIIACTPSPVKQKVERIDSLQTKVEQIDNQFQKIDRNFFVEALKTNEEKARYVQENYKDTMEKETAFLFGDYVRIRKNLKRYMDTYDSQKEQLAYTQKQLADLEKDIKNQFIADNEFNMYFESESEAVERLNETVSNLGAWGESTQKRFNELDSVVTVFIETKMNS